MKLESLTVNTGPEKKNLRSEDDQTLEERREDFYIHHVHLGM